MVLDSAGPIQLGDIVIAPWGDVFTWTDDCVDLVKLEGLTKEADSLCDAAVAALSSFTSHDLLHTIQSSSHHACTAFASAVSKDPPIGVAADPLQLARAREFFSSYAIPILQSLLHISIACGLASPQISQTLRRVSRLTPPSVCPMQQGMSTSSNDRIVRRLLETVQFVVDICGSAPFEDKAGKTKAWKGAVNVRILHSIMRRRLNHEGACPGRATMVSDECSSLSSNQGDMMGKQSTVPINQAELAVTLASFCVAPLIGLQKMGFKVSATQKDDFVALWRHYGHFLGVSDTILYQNFSTFEKANLFLHSTASRMLVPSQGGEALEPVTQILWAMSNNSIIPYYSFESSCALTRYLIGERMADSIDLPRVSVSAYWKMKLGLAITNIPIHVGEAGMAPFAAFANSVRKSVTTSFLPMAVRQSLRWQGTQYSPREEEHNLSSAALRVHLLLWTMVHVLLLSVAMFPVALLVSLLLSLVPTLSL